MSEYTSYSYEYEPAVASSSLATAAGLAVGALVLAGSATINGVSALARRHADRMRAFEAGGHSALEAHCLALADSPLLQATVIAELGGGTLSPAHFALPELQRAGAKAFERLRKAETQVLAERLAAVLTERGYELVPSRGPAHEGMLQKGVRSDHTSVVARVLPGRGTVEIDLGGFNGMGCSQERAAIEQGLRRRGVQLRVQARQQHGCALGGALLRVAQSGEQSTGTGVREK